MTTHIITDCQKDNKNKTMPVAFGRPIPPGMFFKVNKRYHYPSNRWQIVIRCPFCGREHVHGWAEDNLPVDPKQTRGAHCEFGDQYRIVVEGGDNGK